MSVVESTIPISVLKGVGPATATHLASLNLLTVQDLLFHLPFRYEDRSRIYSIAAVKVSDRVLIEGNVISLQITGKRRYLRCVIRDDSHRSLELIFFYFAQSHQKKLQKINTRIRVFGEVRWGFSGHLEMVHPEYAPIDDIANHHFLSLLPGLSPVYSTVKGLHQATLRKLMQQALHCLREKNILPELLPEILRQQFNALSIGDALQWIHFPPIEVDSVALLQAKHPAQQRLIFEELLAHQLSLRNVRQHIRQKETYLFQMDNTLENKLRAALPFQLTAAQERVLSDIKKDFLTLKPMMRLLQGDVGAGKTIVACMAALPAIQSGFQVALMAPTEILAEQHFQNFLQWFSPLSISVDMLLGKQTAAEQKKAKEKLLSGQTQFIIGTHALFQKEVVFKKLALLIIDEQHRFGVQQRLSLMSKGLHNAYFPHQLIMTATPIPRTLSMTAYADLDCSVIDELPPHRKPITTVLLSSQKRNDVIERVRLHCQQKHQAYWICTLITESDELQCEAAEQTAILLQNQLKPLRVGLIHGRLKSVAKNQIMRAFQQGEIDLLVATTVVEVGVDIRNASLMIIENSERLGLSQLHQLRGRVGRGDQSSFCVLLYQSPLSETAQKRLNVMRETQDGFLIAERDLQMRGPGDVLGQRQSGEQQWRVVDLMRDQALLPLVEKASTQLQSDKETITALIARWIGGASHYLNA
ncbi:MAG: ATP-dependent DNA helicase RecG [Gammaproteobacteria bacterium RIFCSPLOWO2_02_FULL_42_14]|nr:MAG: ATP-dependent DNA helicase RecG [Gammaproteobacteria bacterium RIFCSPHIGHO2_02_FULL_42_43]OGT52129.1 MAG: ATP-dependent DNA helicase RecG [Gammaproteobacteria bacterium RIFCSPHIGHO2_12_FULL_41_25]OGT62566.1 MAG: ATP-dependent DNA helicase RecG [Gammaproteobacteria bacterium RIFCSPLOWO2_02_FULL_42_14]OGT86549.1 MAG: ATP-dependent DNA helicase RecG [Gammaproteobacteria bacterium RIFCSPLOWO2_12_FULL_42_18]